MCVYANMASTCWHNPWNRDWITAIQIHDFFWAKNTNLRCLIFGNQIINCTMLVLLRFWTCDGILEIQLKSICRNNKKLHIYLVEREIDDFAYGLQQTGSSACRGHGFSSHDSQNVESPLLFFPSDSESQIRPDSDTTSTAVAAAVCCWPLLAVGCATARFRRKYFPNQP